VYNSDAVAATSDRAQTDLALLVRISRRDPSAVGELYDAHSRLLFSLILRIVRDEGEAEDVLQEVLLRIWEKADTYDPVLGTPTAWLVRIARNRAIDRVRTRLSQPVAVPSEEVPPLVVVDEGLDLSPERAALQGERHQAIAAALRQIPGEQRVLIEQAFFQGYTQSELAARFNLPLGTVKTRIRTGMLAMRKHLLHLSDRDIRPGAVYGH
jgi:RNA polymerase sigma-70 factor (ECF subfamily)